MATARKSNFDLPTLDDLFSSQAERDEAKLAKIRDIPISEIDDFPEHPFKVRDDEDMTQLIESIKERGVITPATVRLKEDGRYEMISGHRRKRASELAGFDTLRCEVVDLSKEEATILMVESNFQRSQILPSEKAFAYKMRYDAIQRIVDRWELGKVDKAAIVTEAEKDIAERAAVEREVPTKTKGERIVDEAVGNPTHKEMNSVENPMVAKTDKNPPSRHDSDKRDMQTDKGVAKSGDERPSVKEKLDRYKAARKQEAERIEPERSTDKVKSQTKNNETIHHQPKKKKKSKER